MVTTYAIDRCTDSYFALGPDLGGVLDESVRALTGVDERKLAEWLTEIMAGLEQHYGDGIDPLYGQQPCRAGRSRSGDHNKESVCTADRRIW
jgi:hypothetical protein